MKTNFVAIWGVPTLLFSTFFFLIFSFNWGKPFSGALIGFLVGQFFSFLTFAIDDGISKNQIKLSHNNPFINSLYYFFSLWGIFFKTVIKLSIFGIGITLGILIVIILVITLIVNGL